MNFLQIILYPVAFLYGCLLQLRNWMFDLHILKSRSYPVAIISLGNLSMGGTGKTPHTEYLIRLLRERFFTAVISRGYKRESSGFILASRRSNVKYIGDEPVQYVRKFDNVKVAVDEKRTHGIETMLEKFPGLDVILLDDAFQHRFVRAGKSILLTDYHRMYHEDHVFPSGTLREFKSGARRADIIVVTKTPKIFSPITRRRIMDDLHPDAHQKIFFSFIKYGDLFSVNDNQPCPEPVRWSYILLFTGIANNYPLCEYLERLCNQLEVMPFPDHYVYTADDLEKIRGKFMDLPSKKKIIVTTEKDAMRLKVQELSVLCKSLPLYYIPIGIEFHGNDKELFDKEILDYVEENKRDRRVP